MPKVTCNMAMSLVGFVAGPNQSQDNPIGEGGMQLMGWMSKPENAEERAILTSAGAYILGRNMFAPGRGEWDLEWKGWWGEDPPYHAPTFVLTHYEREPLEMDGGTTFHFVTEGIEAALRQAREAAGEGSVDIAGGASAARQYLAAGHVDELRLHVSPVLLGSGERLFEGVAGIELEQTGSHATQGVTHLTYDVTKGE